MSKKHLVALAAALAKSRPPLYAADALRQWTRDVNAVADACAVVAPAFDREKFLNAAAVSATTRAIDRRLLSAVLCPYCDTQFTRDYYESTHVPCPENTGDSAPCRHCA